MSQIYQNFIKAKSANDLLRELERLNIDVPKRSQRTKEHTEKYIMCRFLSTFADMNLFPYPISIQKGERPDFLFSFIGECIGVEVTEASSSSYSSYLALAERERPEHFIDFGHFSNRESLNLSQKRELLGKNKITSRGFVGSEMEKSWKGFISEAIEKKSKKFLDDEFQKFHRNWLLIYDNTPTTILMQKYLIPYIEEIVSENSAYCFDKIFIETSWEDEGSFSNTSKIIQLSSEGFEVFSLNNLWE